MLALIEGGHTVCGTQATLAYLESVHRTPLPFGETLLQASGTRLTICECGRTLREPVGDNSRPLSRGKVTETLRGYDDA